MKINHLTLYYKTYYGKTEAASASKDDQGVWRFFSKAYRLTGELMLQSIKHMLNNQPGNDFIVRVESESKRQEFFVVSADASGRRTQAEALVAELRSMV